MILIKNCFIRKENHPKYNDINFNDTLERVPVPLITAFIPSTDKFLEKVDNINDDIYVSFFVYYI